MTINDLLFSLRHYSGSAHHTEYVHAAVREHLPAKDADALIAWLRRQTFGEDTVVSARSVDAIAEDVEAALETLGRAVRVHREIARRLAQGNTQ
jgi:aryl-alcohol dehydrogenase-like predicted oxidoreductase